MMRTFDALERDQQGYASTNGLLSVVNGLKSLPGRKTVVFFSEGLAIPTNVQAQFRSVIHNANRANVSVYAMDAAGLRAEQHGRGDARRRCSRRASGGAKQLESAGDSASGAMTRDLERNEDLLRLDPESGLGQLANETGGFLIRDTNDADAGFRRIEEDMRFHYLLGLLALERELRRPVPHDPREGEAAGRAACRPARATSPLRAPESVPVRSFEAPALALLDRQPRPSAFARGGRGPELSHREAAGPGAGAGARARQHRRLRARPAGQERQEDAPGGLHGDGAGEERVGAGGGPPQPALLAARAGREPGRGPRAATCSSTGKPTSRPAATPWRRWPTTRWPRRPAS